MNKVEAYKKLADLKSSGVDIVSQVKSLAESSDVPESVEKFIESFDQSESKKFFENLRKMHNDKGHRLYSNILDENLDELGTLKCLSSYMTNAVIAMENMDEPTESKLIELRKSIGLEVVSEALADYYNGRDYDKIKSAKNYIKSLIK